MFTEAIIRHCAPTLAGLKVSNLFSCKYVSVCELFDIVNEKNMSLNPKGVYFVVLKAKSGIALIFVYRKNALDKILEQENIREFLKQFKYTNFNIDYCLNNLKERLLSCDFPHEIGIFLGYPLDDVSAFIYNKGANSMCVGCWKVYTNVCDAERTFRAYKKCTSIYCKKFAEGLDLTRLTVAG